MVAAVKNEGPGSESSIMDLLRRKEMSVKGLARETGFAVPTVYAVTRRLQAEKKIMSRRRGRVLVFTAASKLGKVIEMPKLPEVAVALKKATPAKPVVQSRKMFHTADEIMPDIRRILEMQTMAAEQKVEAALKIIANNGIR
jgi:hypothetical protein